MQEMQRRRICGQIGVVGAHEGKLFRAGNDFVALKIENVVESILRTMRLQPKLTKRMMNLAHLTRIFDLISRACSFSLIFSYFSNTCSSLKVGLRMASIFLGAAPGLFNALLRGLLRGVFGVMGAKYLWSVSSTSTDSCPGLDMKPKPMSEICG